MWMWERGRRSGESVNQKESEIERYKINIFKFICIFTIYETIHLNFDACSSSHKSKLTSYWAHIMSMALSRASLSAMHAPQCFTKNKITTFKEPIHSEFIEMFLQNWFYFHFFKRKKGNNRVLRRLIHMCVLSLTKAANGINTQIHRMVCDSIRLIYLNDMSHQHR